MKIKKVVSQRVVRRIRNMFIAATMIGCVTYMSDWSVKDMLSSLESNDTDMSDYGIFVNADEDETDAGEQQLRRLAELTSAEKAKAKFEKRVDYKLPWPMAFCIRGEEGCLGPYTRRRINKEMEDEYGLKYQVWTGAYENREIGISYKNAKSYEFLDIQRGSNGFVEEYWDTQSCFSFILVPGTQLMPKALLAVFYMISLGYLFIGVGIVSDIFMEAIETITAVTETQQLYSKDGKQVHMIDVPKWNATVANLTLMALGSSAPEILLSVLQTLQDLEGIPPVLGPSTIVGSAAFNLLVISGLSVLAVGDTPKKVNDLGVFAITSVASLWAYIWLYLCLEIFSPVRITLVEGWLTLLFFILLIVFAYAADRLNNHVVTQNKNAEELLEDRKKEEMSIKKGDLRNLAKQYGDKTIIEIAQGLNTEKTSGVPQNVQEDVNMLFKEILDTETVKDIEINVLLDQLQPDSLLDRFAFRKAGGLGSGKEFMKLKGTTGQTSKDVQQDQIKSPNPYVGFKCLHYSVTESSGQVEITIIKKCQNEITVGFRTVADTAFAPKDFSHVDEQITFGPRETEKKIQIPIVDDDEWEPDLDFFVELYDPNKTPSQPQYHGEPIDGQATFTESKVIENSVDKLEGDDTQCKVTILDEDFPGCLGFEDTDVSVKKGSNSVCVTVKRFDGQDGRISCMLRTEQLVETQSRNNAIEFEDYLPKEERVTFQHHELFKQLQIELVNNDHMPPTDKKEDNEQDDSEEGEPDVMFKVKLEKPEPAGVKISKKNVCLVTISKNEEFDQEEEDKRKLIEFYMAQKEVTWTSQFRTAITLGPQISEEDLILEDVSLYEALIQFLAIFWRFLFATIPPPNMSDGKWCFIISLSYIGCVTLVIGEVATVLGCVAGIKESVTAITFVALGTSLPDTFASMSAAQSLEYADAAIGNVTGSNSVNVFLGLGLPWAIASTYWQVVKPGIIGKENFYEVPAGDIGFSVFVFLIVAIICFMILVLRRIFVGGELGGPGTIKYLSAILMIGLWFIYIMLSTLQAYNIISFQLGGDKKE